ncbi:hypothetical protein E2C01_091625 [Portunus trituberculatus]|uniref:Uncharacterized protein n=1 Tax=Portunus trituberculatus TaxID=210409 RepID=A0A5B7JTE6_PORTR|nr:hypothetical protein [Portunus trituberculatus]
MNGGGGGGGGGVHLPSYLAPPFILVTSPASLAHNGYPFCPPYLLDPLPSIWDCAKYGLLVFSAWRGVGTYDLPVSPATSGVRISRRGGGVSVFVCVCECVNVCVLLSFSSGGDGGAKYVPDSAKEHKGKPERVAVLPLGLARLRVMSCTACFFGVCKDEGFSRRYEEEEEEY